MALVKILTLVHLFLYSIYLIECVICFCCGWVNMCVKEAVDLPVCMKNISHAAQPLI